MSPRSVHKSVRVPQVGELPAIELRGHTFEEHREFVPALVEAMAGCGCWLLEQRSLSPTATALHFELQLRSVFDLYGGLLACGVGLTRDSHARMKSLCTVRDHNPHQARRRRILTVRLELVFLEEADIVRDLAITAMGLA